MDLGVYGPTYRFPDGSPPRRPRRWRRWLWLVPVIVVVVGAAIVVPTILRGTETSLVGPTTRHLPEAEPWQLKASEVPPLRRRLAAWSTDDALVTVADRYAASYARVDGEQRWRTTPPDGMTFCGSGTSIVDNQVALAFGKDGDTLSADRCANVTVLDVKTGQLTWTQPFTVKLKGEGRGASHRPRALAQIVDDTVVVTRNQGIVGFDLATGQQKWTKPIVRQVDGQEYCDGSDMAAKGGSILLTIGCNPSDYDLTLLMLDPDSGTVTREKTFTSTELGFTRQFGLESIASIDPLVVHLTGDSDPGPDPGSVGLNLEQAYVIFDGGLNRTQVIDAGTTGQPGSLVSTGSDGFGTGLPEHSWVDALITNGLLVTVTFSLNGTKNSMVAFDLQSGTRRWQAQTEGTIMTPAALDGDDVIAPVSSLDRAHGPVQIVRVRVSDGALRTVGTYQVKESDQKFSVTLGGTRFIWADHRLYAIRGWFPLPAYDASQVLTIYTIG